MLKCYAQWHNSLEQSWKGQGLWLGVLEGNLDFLGEFGGLRRLRYGFGYNDESIMF